MIDAATIGITLALNNGVSDGIAQIRRDLAALDAAVNASAAGLTRLAALAEGAGLALPARAAAALLPPAPRPTPAAAPAEAMETGAPATGAAPAASPLPAPMPTAPASGGAAPIPPAPAPAAPIAAIAPRAAPGLADFAAHGRALAARAEESAPAPAHIAVPELADPMPWPTMPARAAPAAPPAAPPIAPSAALSAELTYPDTPRAAAAPLAPSPQAYAAPAAPTPAHAASGPDPSHQAPATASVEITLDGAVLSRWMGDALSRQATRPPATAAAFDPRLSPAWTGV